MKPRLLNVTCPTCGITHTVDAAIAVFVPNNSFVGGRYESKCESCKRRSVRERMRAANERKTTPPVNFTSNVPTGTEVASVFPYKSSSNPNTRYECRLYTDGTTSCNCPGWTRQIKNGRRECKHTRDVDTKKAGILAALTGQMPANLDAPSTNYPSTKTKPIAPKAGRVFNFEE